jgi:hypothetical protein
MDKETKITLFVVLGLIVVGGTITAIVLHKNNKDVSNSESGGSGGSTADDYVKPNLDDLLSNMGSAAVKSKDGKSVGASFNGGVNGVAFFSNGRFQIADTKTKKSFMGSWSNGGKRLTPDGKSEIKSSSVWGNLLTAIK